MPEKFEKFILFTTWGEGLPLAYHLKLEGMEVMVGMADDMKTVMEKESEDKDQHKNRWSQYEGLMEKHTCEELLKKMEKIENKDEWCVLFDFNTLWPFADQAKKMGFKYGLFPTQLDYKMEADRDFAKRFVVANYPGIKVAEVEEFKTIEDGINFINESDEYWALKGNDTSCTTVVPRSKNLDNVKAELIDSLQSGKESYEKKGYILERQIRDGLEICPQMIYMDGKRVASSIDLEDKAFSATDSSEMYGCSLNMIVATPMDCLANQIAFPAACDKLAKKHQGLYWIDANLICKDGEYYFLEFCSGRMGFDAVFAECEMAGSVSGYFNALLHGENPYLSKYGVGFRGFMQKREDDGTIKDGIVLRMSEEERHFWLFGVRKDGGKIINTKGSWGDSTHGIDLLSITEDSDDMEFAIIKTKDVISNFSFNGLYIRDNMHCLKERVSQLEKFIEPQEVD